MQVPGTVKLDYLATRSCAERLRRLTRYYSAVLAAATDAQSASHRNDADGDTSSNAALPSLPVRGE